MFLLMSALNGFAQIPISDSIINVLSKHAFAYESFGNMLPQEKVYLHLDNTSYYQDDLICFQSYIVNAATNVPADLSKTLYVELLNPGGDVVSKLVLPIENGRSKGSFKLDHLPFYSGFYEVRAYTKYMLNWGNDLIYSRIIPVFDQPTVLGSYTEKKIMKNARKTYPHNRAIEKKAKAVNLKFYPEGGYLVEGLTSQVAFEATDAFGNPIDLNGCIKDINGKELVNFTSEHEGRGAFLYLANSKQKKAVVEYENKTYEFDLPEVQNTGFVLHVDNLSDSDSILIEVQKNLRTPASVLGLSVLSQGRSINSFVVPVEDNQPLKFKVGRDSLSDGVSQIVLFNTNGDIIADRLIFNNKQEALAIDVAQSKSVYTPYESIQLKVALKDQFGKPTRAPISISVRDGNDEVMSRNSILTDLLLMSDVKGYVRNPFYYFDSIDNPKLRALDQLLMVQGWRRYSWDKWTQTNPEDIKYMPEQGVEVHGKVVSYIKGKPKANVQVSALLCQVGYEDSIPNSSIYDTFISDSLGQFSFVTDVDGKRNMILSVMEKGKKKDHRIVLDRVMDLEPQKYALTEMQVMIAENKNNRSVQLEYLADSVLVDESYDAFMERYEDSLRKKGIDEKIHRLKEVDIKANKRDKAQEIYEARASSIKYYDIQAEIDDLKDKEVYFLNNIHDLLANIDPNFVTYRKTIDPSIMPENDGSILMYKSMVPMVIINYEYLKDIDDHIIKQLIKNVAVIKSIYISKDLRVINRYIDNKSYSGTILPTCAIFVETFSEGEMPVKGGKGVRKTWLEGYSQVKEFYQPDYTVLPKEEDYRRTLYWNPELVPDENGVAVVSFFNNSSCKQLKITAETISEDGSIGVYTE
ncbi:MAG: hypothetical protein ACRC13_04905 [Tannerellaceae bacterium]